jgi:hypothetical protein
MENITMPIIPKALESIMEVEFSGGHWKLYSLMDGERFPLYSDHARLAAIINFKISPWKILTTAVIKGYGSIALMKDKNTEKYKWIDPMQLSIAVTNTIDEITEWRDR